METLEISAIEHLNGDHGEAIGRYAVQLLGARPGPWKIVALDAEGCHLGLEEEVLRLDFPAPARGAAELRHAFRELSDRTKN
jgi:hypothetical protein